MRLTLDLPDDLADLFLTRLKGNPDERLAQLSGYCAQHLSRFRAGGIAGRPILLTSEERMELEQTLGKVFIANAKDLIHKVRFLAGLEFGLHRFHFTPMQLAELKRKAERQNRTVEQIIDSTLKGMERLFFSYVDHPTAKHPPRATGFPRDAAAEKPPRPKHPRPPGTPKQRPPVKEV